MILRYIIIELCFYIKNDFFVLHPYIQIYNIHKFIKKSYILCGYVKNCTYLYIGVDYSKKKKILWKFLQKFQKNIKNHKKQIEDSDNLFVSILFGNIYVCGGISNNVF